MILHFHYSTSPNSGEIKRISNIDQEFASYFSLKTVEVVFCSIKDYRKVTGKNFFRISENVKKKICIPCIPKVRVLNYFYETVMLIILSLIYRPKFVIGEMYYPQFFNLFKRMNSDVVAIADIHGALVEENIYQKPDITKSQIDDLKRVERNTILSADYILCQSDEMKRYISENYDCDFSKIFVYRCGYDTNLFYINKEARNEIRTKLNVDNHVLFIYAGGLHKWQKIEDSLMIFLNYHKENQLSKFLVLTSWTNQLNEILANPVYQSIRDSVISFSVPFNQVPDYLNASDIAFLIRDNHTMNAVASPTKLGEYMACGLPIISSRISKKWVSKSAEDYIIIVDSTMLNRKIDECINKIDKAEINRYAVNNLSLEIDHKNIINLMRKFDVDVSQ